MTVAPSRTSWGYARARYACPDAHARSRNVPACMATGQAAGVAAAIAVEEGVTVRNVPVSKVQAPLRKLGMPLHAEQIVERATTRGRRSGGGAWLRKKPAGASTPGRNRAPPMFQASAPGRGKEPHPLSTRSTTNPLWPALTRGPHLDVAGIGVIGRIRTDTVRIHSPGLCWLSYDHHCSGCPGRLRTSSRRVNSAPLHRLSYWTMFSGEAREIRAPTAGFGDRRSARELAPRGCHGWILTSDLPLIGRLLSDG